MPCVPRASRRSSSGNAVRGLPELARSRYSLISASSCASSAVVPLCRVARREVDAFQSGKAGVETGQSGFRS